MATAEKNHVVKRGAYVGAPSVNGGTADIPIGSPVFFNFYTMTAAAQNEQRVIPPVAAGLEDMGLFAGIMLQKLEYSSTGLGDIASAQRCVRGQCKANFYYSSTGTGTPNIGAHLRPTIISGVPCLTQCDYNTGIVLLEDCSAFTQDTMYSEATGDGVLVTLLARDPICGISHLRVEAPDAADADYYLNDKATSATAATTVTSGWATSNIPDHARNVTVTPGGTTADVAAGNVVITGTNIYGEVITENIAIPENGASLVAGAKAFASVTSVVFPQQDGAGATFDVGFADVIGMRRCFANAPACLQAKAAGTVEGTLPTIVVDQDDIESNTIDFNTASDGTKDFDAWICAA